MKPGRYVSGHEFASAGLAELRELTALPHLQGTSVQTGKGKKKKG